MLTRHVGSVHTYVTEYAHVLGTSAPAVSPSVVARHHERGGDCWHNTMISIITKITFDIITTPHICINNNTSASCMLLMKDVRILLGLLERRKCMH